jgi:thiol:disulfide interchange protein DsbD
MDAAFRQDAAAAKGIVTSMLTRLAAAFLLAAAMVPASAMESAPVVTKHATASLITSADSVVPGGSVRAGLRLRMTEGWHTYWRNPGDAGVPTELTFTLADDAKAGPIEWPTPSRQTEGTIVTYGFTGEVVLPVAITIPPGDHGLSGTMKATWLICKEICVPEEASFSIALPPGPGTPSAEAPLFAAHDQAVPRDSPWAATIAGDGTLYVKGAELNARTVAGAWFTPDAPDQIVDSAPQTLSVRDGGFTLGLTLAKDHEAGAALRGILSIRDRGGIQTNVLLGAFPGPAPDAAVPLAEALLFAFLGGLILNLMPCVFPILAMKAVGFAAGLAHGRAKAHAISYTAGVMTAFVGVAGALLAARAGGAAAGWGFQFSSPVFVAGMAWLLFMVGLNLSGVFRVGGGFAGIGGGLAAREGHFGSFFTGALAVLVATPCTAPFMSVAIATGLAAAPAVTVVIFVAMGLGLASPYLLLSLVPALGRAMPRPGRWMEVLRQVLAFPMYGASVWLVWVISQESGSTGVLVTASGIVVLGFAGWLRGLTQDSGRAGRRAGWCGVVAAGCVAVALLVGIEAAPAIGATATTERETDGIEAFSPTRLAALRAEGRPVFVNLTAAWCVTCLVNERVAISKDSVRQAFGSRGVVYLKGDWTRQDPVITTFLREHGRDGVPLYLYYGPGAASPEVLPQILTESIVLEAVGRRL